MRMIHVTPIGNLQAILRNGLQPRLARTNKAWIWLALPTRLAWLLHHIEQHQQTTALAVLEVEVPRSWLLKAPYGLKGCKVCRRHIASERISLLWTVAG